MSLLLETIRLDDGVPSLLALHQERVDRSLRDLFGHAGILNLKDFINPPDEFRKGTVKCRILYGKYVEKVEYNVYHINTVKSLQMVEADTIIYNYKYADRTCLEFLHGLRGECDDVLIIKNGLVTDTTYANVAFYDGSCWVTPEKPLLEGVRRRFYLERGMIVTARITPGDLKSFSEVKLMNAMISLEESPSIPVRCIMPVPAR
ncbi:MAG: aminotransferase class IV [Bacteroidales bacterium]